MDNMNGFKLTSMKNGRNRKHPHELSFAVVLILFIYRVVLTNNNIVFTYD